jgi:hypothetical protein
MLRTTIGRALRFNQGETARGNAFLEYPFFFAEYHWIDPHPVFVDKVSGHQGLQQIAAVPDVQFRPGRSLDPAPAATASPCVFCQVLPVKLIQAARKDIFVASLKAPPTALCP